MIVAIPTETDDGLACRVAGHFGHAGWYAVVDTESDAVQFVAKRAHSHNNGGGCAPVEALEQHHVSRVLCLGLGQGAYQRLTGAGYQVDCINPATGSMTLGDVLSGLKDGSLPIVARPELCAGHQDH